MSSRAITQNSNSADAGLELGRWRYGLERASLGHVEIDTFRESELVEEVLDHAFHGRETRQIVTVNAQFYVLAENNPAFRACLQRAEYHCADGVSIVWACKKFGRRNVPRIAGVDLVTTLCSRGAEGGLRVFLLGGRPGTAADTANLLKKNYPGIVIAGVECPPWGFHKDPGKLQATLAQIESARPHVLFLALGAPKQELFIDEHVRKLGIPLAVGIGGSFEILSGATRRAPRWIQRVGFEWAFRMMQEPGRLWKRYLFGNVEFLWCVAKWRYRLHQASAQEPA
jgi:N-acetylglucosaminyldiphosphoundecaprenol N-acetyl-beta-D-mannosaminyltransferase